MKGIEEMVVSTCDTVSKSLIRYWAYHFKDHDAAWSNQICFGSCKNAEIKCHLVCFGADNYGPIASEPFKEIIYVCFLIVKGNAQLLSWAKNPLLIGCPFLVKLEKVSMFFNAP